MADIALIKTDQHIVEIVDLATEIWNEYYVALTSKAQVDYMLEKFQSVNAITSQIEEGWKYHLVSDSAVSVGYFAVVPDYSNSKMLISKFYVKKEHRNKGWGRAMLDFIEDISREHRINTLWLTVNKKNPAIAVYEKLGFVNVAPIVSHIGEGFVMDDFRMEKVLT